MKANKSFWLVWRDGGGASTNKHAAEELAIEEAERLALKHPGVAFYVLFPVTVSEIVSPVITRPMHVYGNSEVMAF